MSVHGERVGVIPQLIWRNIYQVLRCITHFWGYSHNLSFLIIQEALLQCAAIKTLCPTGPPASTTHGSSLTETKEPTSPKLEHALHMNNVLQLCTACVKEPDLVLQTLFGVHKRQDNRSRSDSRLYVHITRYIGFFLSQFCARVNYLLSSVMSSSYSPVKTQSTEGNKNKREEEWRAALFYMHRLHGLQHKAQPAGGRSELHGRIV